MVNHGEAVHSNEWRKLPIEEQMAWRIPISVMLNMSLLRSTQPVITVSEYLRLHNISDDVEQSDGHWGRYDYHVNHGVFDNTGRSPSLHIIENEWYDPWGINRIDLIPEDMKRRGGWSSEGGNTMKGEKGRWTNTLKTPAYLALEAELPDKRPVLAWDQARHALRKKGFEWAIQTDERMEEFLNENGWEVLYTYNGA
jgi:hypothetical protein